MIWGLQFKNASLARSITRAAFNQGLLLETCGINRDTVKIMPPLVIERDLLEEGMALLFCAIEEVKSKTDAFDSDSAKEIGLSAYDNKNT
jgi:diaminobutyrate-2-oxoglutarate transaminase